MHLPVCENQVSAESHHMNEDESYQQTYVINKDTYNLCDLIRGLVAADCWAVAIGEHIAYNSYRNEYTDECLAQFDRDSFIDDPSIVLQYISDNGVDTYLDIYMFEEPSSWKVRLSYTAQNQTYDCTIFNH